MIGRFGCLFIGIFWFSLKFLKQGWKTAISEADERRLVNWDPVSAGVCLMQVETVHLLRKRARIHFGSCTKRNACCGWCLKCLIRTIIMGETSSEIGNMDRVDFMRRPPLSIRQPSNITGFDAWNKLQCRSTCLCTLDTSFYWPADTLKI